MMFSHTIISDGKTALIKASCPIDTRSAGDFKSHCEHLLSKSITTLILDGNTVEYASSEGLYALFQISRSAREAGGAFFITSPSRELKVLLSLLNLNNEFGITDSVESAFKISSIEGSEQAADIQARPVMPDQIITEPELASEMPVNESFDIPIVVECEECGAFVRVHSSGRFLCPSCNVEFTAEKDGTVIF